MLMKTAVTALLGLAIAAEAATVHQYRSTSTLDRRQNRGGRFGGGNNNNNNNNNNGGNDNNNNNNNGGNNNNNGGNNNNNNNNGGNNNGATETCLAANAIQTGSQSTGQNGGVAADGQVNSAT
jgi:hypothetical protein